MVSEDVFQIVCRVHVHVDGGTDLTDSTHKDTVSKTHAQHHPDPGSARARDSPSFHYMKDHIPRYRYV